jgi:hypothetical protein
MSLTMFRRARTSLVSLSLAALGTACGPAQPEVTGTGGGGTTSGGAVAFAGGAPSSGGTVSSGGGVAVGGSGLGGTSTGGGNATGGQSSTGGAASGGGPGGGASSGGGEVGAGGAAAGGSASGGALATGGSGPEGPILEDDGEDCDVGTVPMSIAADPDLPDPFKKPDGSRISTKSEWKCQRRYLRKVMEATVYGEKPPKPEMVTGTVSDESIAVNVSHQGKSASFTVEVDLPSTGSAPYPVVIGYLGFGSISLNETFVKNQGVAIIKYDPYQVGAEGTGRNNKSGDFYSVHGQTHAKTGLLVAWAWGVSRIIDVIEASGTELFKTDGIAVTGCSRFGKGSFVAGAFDQRIALGIPFESGSAGVPILRGIGELEASQSLSSAYGEQPWFGDVFSPFVSNIDTLPMDTHGTIGMYAPRGLMILDNPHIANLGPKAAHVAALAGAEIYKALGVPGNIAYMSNVQSGDHCSWRAEFEAPLKAAIDMHLKKTGSTAGTINARSTAQGNLADFRTWTTPTLN